MSNRKIYKHLGMEEKEITSVEFIILLTFECT
jgi:hypothetical protein